MIALNQQLSDLLDAALADGTPCLVGTASKDGAPQISPKGSVAVYDEHTLCYWERAHRSAARHLAENPHVVVYYRNAARAKEMPFAGGAVRFHGTGRIVSDPAVREQVWAKTIPAEQERDPEKKGVGVLIDVQRVEELSGKIVMQKD